LLVPVLTFVVVIVARRDNTAISIKDVKIPAIVELDSKITDVGPILVVKDVILLRASDSVAPSMGEAIYS
jgi:hypothetical protein